MNICRLIPVPSQVAMMLSFLCVAWISSAQTVIPTNLHDSVPYQGDTLLVNPLPMNVHDTDQAYLDCDWVTLMSMIRDLEERIATALEVDTVYDVYVSGQVVGTSIFMHYDCVVLRDSIISLQIELDEALLGPPTVLSQEVLSIAQNVATIKAKITDDGGAPVRLWGVLFGKQTWWNDTLGFFSSDSLNITNLTDYTAILDSTLATRWDAMPAPAVMDTASLNVDSVFVTDIKGLDRYTDYIAVPIAANDSLFAEPYGVSNFERSEWNVGPFGWYGIGDTLMFRTLPDTASGFTLDTANVLQNTARLIFTVSDAGGQGPDDAGFFYDTQDFTPATFAGDSIASDSTGGMTHTAELTGLTRYTDYYFRGYADNLAGRGNSESSFTFKTLPDIPTFDTVYYNGTVDSLNALIDDNGGVVPTTQGFKYAEGDATMASPTSLIGALVGDLFSAELLQSALTAGQNYYAAANATNEAGTGYSDTIQFVTPPAVTTAAATAMGEETLTINGSVSYAQVGPDSVGFQWATDSALAGASDTTVVEQSDSTFMATLTGLAPGTKYYFAAEAANAGGTKTGSTLYGATRASVAAGSAVRTAPPATSGSPAPGTLFSPVPSSNEVHYKFTATADYDNAAPTSQRVVYSYDSGFSDSVLLTVPTLVNEYGIEAEDGLNWGAELYFYAAVANEAGTSHSDTLTVYTVPEVTSVTASAIGETSLTLNGLVGYDDAAPSSVGFNWATSLALTGASDTTVVEQSDSTFMAALTGLAPGTKYYFAAEATNAGGTESGDTLSTATLIHVQGLALDKYPDGGWDNTYRFIGVGEFGNAGPTSQKLVYSYEPNLSDSISAAATLYNTDSLYAEQHNLQEGAEIHFIFEVVNESGTSRSDTVQVFTKLGVDTEAVALPTPSSLQLNGTVNWVDSVAMPTSVGFHWGTAADLSGAQDTTVQLAADSSFTAAIEGLQSGTKYYFRAIGTNPAGTENGSTSNKSTLVGFTVDSLVAGAYSSSGLADANFYGTADYTNSAPTSTTFYLDDETPPAAPQSAIGTVNQGAVTGTLSQVLSPGTRYRLNLIGTNETGTSYSDTLSQATSPLAVLDSVADAAVVALTFHGRSLYDDVPSTATGFMWSTASDLSNATDTSVVASSDSTFAATVSGLEPGTRYYVAATAENEGGEHISAVTQTATLVEVLADSLVAIASNADSTTYRFKGLVRDGNAAFISGSYTYSYQSDLSDSTKLTASLVDDSLLIADHANLLPGSVVYFAAKATNEAGVSFSDTVQAMTLVEVQTLPVTGATDSTAYLNARFTYLSELARPDSMRFAWINSDDTGATMQDTTLPFSAMLPDSTISIQLPFTYGDHYDFTAYAINGAGESEGETYSFCAGACPQSLEYLGKSYGVVRIDCDCLFTENLLTETYVNGDSIIQANSPQYTSNWADIEIGNMVKRSDRGTYGDLYHRAIVDYANSTKLRGVCPSGWKIANPLEVIGKVVSMIPETRYPENWMKNVEALKAMAVSPSDTPSWKGSNEFGIDLLPGGEIDNSLGIKNIGAKVDWLLGNENAILTAQIVDAPTNNNQGVYVSNDRKYGLIRCTNVATPSLPSIFGINAVNSTNSSATLLGYLGHPGWKTTSQELDVLEVGFVWSTDQEFASQSDTVLLSVPANDTLSFDLSGLETGQRYYYKSFASNEVGTEFSDVRYFDAQLPSVPDVVTDRLSHIVVNGMSKVIYTQNLTLVSKGNSEIDSAGWKWSVNPDLSAADDTVQLAGYHSGVENLVLNLTDEFSNVMWGENFLIEDRDLAPGQTIYYAGWAANELGVGWGDTLSTYIPKAIRRDKVISYDHGAEISGKLIYQETRSDSIGIRWSTSGDFLPMYTYNPQFVWDAFYVANYDSICHAELSSSSAPIRFASMSTAEVDAACAEPYDAWATTPNSILDGLSLTASAAHYVAYNQFASAALADGQSAQVRFDAGTYGPVFSDILPNEDFRHDYMANPMDTLYFNENADSTFSVTLTLPDSIEIGTRIYYQLFAVDSHKVSFGAMTHFKTGLCHSVEYHGYTYDSQRFLDDCIFTENLRNDLNNEGDSIFYLDLRPSSSNSLSAAQKSERDSVLALKVPFQAFRDSASLEKWGRVYNIYASSPDSKVCPVGTRIVTYTDAQNLHWAVDYMYPNLKYENGTMLATGDQEAAIFGNNQAMPLSIYASEFLDVNSFAWWVHEDWKDWNTTLTGNPVNEGENLSGYNGSALYLSSLNWAAGNTLWLPYESGLEVAYFGKSESTWNQQVLIQKGFSWQYSGVFDYETSTPSASSKSLRSIRCIVEDEGPSVITEPSTAGSTTSATLQASFEFEGWRTLVSKGFDWGYQPDLSDASQVAGSSASGPFTAEVTSLVEGSTIYYSAFVEDSLGRVSRGDTLAFHTNCVSPELDGYTYDVVKIGDQCWFAENLRSDNYADGSPIAGGLDNASWSATTEGAQAIYGGDSAAYYAEYGRLYNWYAVDNAAGLCPSGWHVPTDEEFALLVDTLGGENVAGALLKSSASDSPAWNGTNSSGWSGLPSGYRSASGSFLSAGDQGAWWTSLAGGYPVVPLAWATGLSSAQSSVYSSFTPQDNGNSVRCLRDEPGVPNVTTAAASGVLETKATLNGSVDFDYWEPITETGFKWGHLSDLSGGAIISGDTLAGDFSAELTGLVLGDTVYFAAYATNAFGTSYGDTLSLVTTNCVPFEFDGYTYDVVKIGDQCWFAENLRSDNYADGSPIPGVYDNSTWEATTEGAQVIFNGDSATYFGDFGRLYNWYAVDSAAGLCPAGWHVPTDAEFTALSDFLGGASEAGTKLKSSASDAPAWDGTNSSGWYGLPGSFRYQSGTFVPDGNGWWWSSSPNGGSAWNRSLKGGLNGFSSSSTNQTYGLSVRCLRDSD